MGTLYGPLYNNAVGGKTLRAGAVERRCQRASSATFNR